MDENRKEIEKNENAAETGRPLKRKPMVRHQVVTKDGRRMSVSLEQKEKLKEMGLL